MWNYCMMALTEQVLVLGSSKNTVNRERPAGHKYYIDMDRTTIINNQNW